MTAQSVEWTAVLRPALRPAARLVVFPHAGSGPLRYRDIPADLPADVEVVGVTLPGRERRAAQPPTTNPAEVVAGVGVELGSLAPLATVLYGHSMGALLALAVAQVDGARCGGVVASCAVPGSRGYPHPERLGSPEGLADTFALHGLADGALADPGLRADRRILAHDLALTQRALELVDPVRLAVPLTVLAGEDDPLVAPGTLPLWGAFTSGPFRGRLVAGGHFFPFAPQGRRVLVAELSRSLETARAADRGPHTGGVQARVSNRETATAVKA